MMEGFLENFKSNSVHLDEDVVSNIVQSVHQYNDALRPFKGKNKIAVIGQSQFTRNNLADAAFSLKEVCETLMNAVSTIVKVPLQKDDHTNAMNEISNKMQESFTNLMKGFEERLMNKIQAPCNGENDIISVTTKDKENHIILVENDEGTDGDTAYTTEKWNEVVSKSISKKLKGIPVDKTVVNKDGKGCMFFSSKVAQEKAKEALDNEYKVVTSSKAKRSVLPKLKIFNVDIDTTKEELKKCIIEKNHEMADSLKNNASKFEIIIIDSVRKYAIAKVTPDVRKVILSKGRVYIGMQGHNVKDHFFPLQCYACQKFGHKQGSPECEKTNGTKTCLYCSENHLSKECGVKREPEKHKCANCASSSNENYKNNYRHAATSFKCPLVIKETNALIRRTAGLESDQSNLFLT